MMTPISARDRISGFHLGNRSTTLAKLANGRPVKKAWTLNIHFLSGDVGCETPRTRKPREPAGREPRHHRR